ncbi:uncharacterized protein OCT59_005703 [Rhizophagus irregularis]|uniref:uncharacterized protein n=1 Tax=Rhizophagus irregularis TaxID=588596 RepID=UPI001C16FB19|nr:hypothetical protein OCT59_005703 [Rhizophagus irregularis]CAB5176410.1 unnamed protein product [Rhizophagus irregularis]
MSNFLKFSQNFSKKKNISFSKIHFITLQNYISSIKFFCYIVGTKVENSFEITRRSDTSIAELRESIYEKKNRVFNGDFEAEDLIPWKLPEEKHDRTFKIKSCQTKSMTKLLELRVAR